MKTFLFIVIALVCITLYIWIDAVETNVVDD